MDGDTAIGQIRADEQERESYLITYSIGREHRSSGYGIQIIHLLEVEMMKKNKSVKVKACVKKDNIASQKIFEYNGYRRQNMQEFFVYEKNLRSR